MKLIPLRGKNGLGKFAKIDDILFERIIKLKWQISHNGYAYYKKGKKNIYLHRFIIGALPGEIVDHKDRNKLNDQKFNLHIVTKSENNRNRDIQKNSLTGIKGVSFHKKNNRYRAYANKNSHRIDLGEYKTIGEAKNAYDIFMGME
ncbi:MAG: HNH endonuclease [Candidatus Levyibacteriota bacterium]